MTVILGEKEKFLRNRLFVVLIAIAVCLRFSALSRFSLWLDEYTSIEVASKSVGAILTGAGFDSHTPPFYYLLLHIYFRIAGLLGAPPDEFTLRLLSALIDTAALLTLFSLVHRVLGETPAMVTTLLYGFLEYPIYFAQEGRMYSLLAFECVLTLWLLLPLSGFTVGRAAMLALVAICGLYTHYYYAFFALGVGIALLFEVKRERKAFLLALGAFAIAGICFLPWLKVLAAISQGGGQSFRPLSKMSVPYSIFRFLAGFALFPLDSATKADQSGAVQASLPLVGSYLLFSSMLLFLGLRSLWSSDATAKRFFLIPVLTSTVLPLLISLKVPMFSERYLSGIFPIIALLFALGVLALPKVRVLDFCVVLLVAIPLWAHFGGERRFGKEQWRETVEYLRERDATQSLVIDPKFISPLLGFYCPECRATALPAWAGAPGYLLRRGEGEFANPAGGKLTLEATFPKESGLFVYRIESMTKSEASDTLHPKESNQ